MLRSKYAKSINDLYLDLITFICIPQRLLSLARLYCSALCLFTTIRASRDTDHSYSSRGNEGRPWWSIEKCYWSGQRHSSALYRTLLYFRLRLTHLEWNKRPPSIAKVDHCQVGSQCWILCGFLSLLFHLSFSSHFVFLFLSPSLLSPLSLSPRSVTSLFSSFSFYLSISPP